MMRRWKGWTVGALALVAGAGAVSLATPARFVPLEARVAARTLHAVVNAVAVAAESRAASRMTIGHMLDPLARPALADEVLQFKPVSAESAARVEARARLLREPKRAASPPAAPARPSAPDTLTRLPEEDNSGSAAPLPPIAPRHAGEMMRIGSDIHVERDQTVDGDVVAISGDVRVDGHVKGSVQSLGGDVYLSSTARVDGDVAAVKGELHEEPGAYVGGQRVTALSGRVPRVGRRHLLDVESTSLVSKSVRELWRFGRALAWLLVMLGLVWLILRITPKRSGAALDVLRRETAASLGIGLLTWVLIVPSIVALALVVAILCITIIGIPVALAALVAYALFLIVLWFWGFVVGAAWLGSQFRGRHPDDSLLRRALIGAIAVLGMRALGHLIAIVPFFGFLGGFLVVVSWVLSGTVTTLGAGALLRSEFASGVLGRWWRGRRADRVPDSGPVPGAPAAATAGSAGMSMASLPAAPPAPPSSYTPPPPPPPPPPGDASGGPGPPAMV